MNLMTEEMLAAVNAYCAERGLDPVTTSVSFNRNRDIVGHVAVPPGFEGYHGICDCDCDCDCRGDWVGCE